ncbi:unnamed protein product [Meloidogyne enterolobii]|uniref:Uncharacterized protein n=1 Tax=Meloidogyne enterolobii TaxID=390850 RepID=A0ACB1AGL5_MELEN
MKLFKIFSNFFKFFVPDILNQFDVNFSFFSNFFKNRLKKFRVSSRPFSIYLPIFHSPNFLLPYTCQQCWVWLRELAPEPGSGAGSGGAGAKILETPEPEPRISNPGAGAGAKVFQFPTAPAIHP